MNRITYHFNKVFNPKANDALYSRFHKTIDYQRFSFFYAARYYVWPCISELGCSFSVIDNKLTVTLDGLRISLSNEEEIFIFYEVFYKRQYAFSGLSKPVVIDIGFNLGLSSIFFLKYCHVDKVYGFEPVSETYHAGISNVNNSILYNVNKISVFNYGLADSDKAITIPYDASNKGSSGIISINTGNDNLQKIKIELKDVHSVVQGIPGDNLVFKIDCEGGEYDILRRMDATGIIRKGALYMMEWHLNGQNDFRELISILERNRFTVIHSRENKMVGMIFAFRLP